MKDNLLVSSAVGANLKKCLDDEVKEVEGQLTKHADEIFL